MLEGIDVSYWQGTIDWERVAAAGKRFAIVRSGDGTFVDPRMGEYLQGAAAAGLAVDIYHYVRFGLSASHQADIILKCWAHAIAVAPVGRLWLDWEDTAPMIRSMSVEQRREWMQMLITALGNIPGGDYTAKWWVDGYLGGRWPIPWPTRRHRWVAAYGPASGFFASDPTASGFRPPLPGGWQDWDIWQYSSAGRVDGIGGAVDLDIAKPGVFGTQEDEMVAENPYIYGFLKLSRNFAAWLAEYPLDEREKLDPEREAREKAAAQAFYDTEIKPRIQWGFIKP